MTALRRRAADFEPQIESTITGNMRSSATRPHGVLAALSIVLIAAGLRWLALPVLGTQNVFITFYPAVILAALYCGLFAGLLAAILAMAIVDYFFMAPLGSLLIAKPADLISMLVFFSSSVLISWVAERSDQAHRRMRRVEAARRDEIETRAAERTAELNRVTEDLKAEISGRVRLEQRFSKIVEAAPTGIIIVDSRGLIDLVNAAAEQAFGYSSCELLGQPVEILLPERFRAHHPNHHRGFLARPETRPMGIGREPLGLRKDGCEFPLEIGLSPLTDGEEVKVICTVVDISARKAADHALFESERLLLLALDASDLGTWRRDLQEGAGNLLWDARSRAMFGFAPDTPVTLDAWKEAIPPEDWPAIEASLNRAMSSDDPHDHYACEYPARRTDGAVRRIAAEGRAFFEPDRTAPSGRKPICIIGTMRDVTEARRADEERHRANELLRTIIETAPGMIFAKDRDGRMLIANAPLLGLLGKAWPEVQGRTDREVWRDEAQAAAVMATDQRIMAAGNTEVVEERFGEEDGRARVWLSTKTPLRDAKGGVTGLVGVSLEITERKRIEDRLRLMVHELNHRVKNTLATVQAIAGQTLRRAEPALRQTLEDRLMALAAAHDVLTREAWEGADLRDIVTASLAPYGVGEDGRFQFCGPPLRLLPRAALALAMGFHELATNAMKYGALSRDAGSVSLRWVVSGEGLHVTWSERGGPPVTRPQRRGFGTVLIERSVARDLGGAASIDFATDGVVCVIEAPLTEVASTAEVLRLPHVGGHHAR